MILCMREIDWEYLGNAHGCSFATRRLGNVLQERRNRNSCFIDGALGLDKTLYRCLQMSTDEGTNTFFFFREKTQFGKKVIQTGPCCSYCIKFDP